MEEQIHPLSKVELELHDEIFARELNLLINKVIYYKDDIPEHLYKTLYYKLSQLAGIVYYRMQPHVFDNILDIK